MLVGRGQPRVQDGVGELVEGDVVERLEHPDRADGARVVALAADHVGREVIAPESAVPRGPERVRVRVLKPAALGVQVLRQLVQLVVAPPLGPGVAPVHGLGPVVVGRPARDRVVVDVVDDPGGVRVHRVHVRDVQARHLGQPVVVRPRRHHPVPLLEPAALIELREPGRQWAPLLVDPDDRAVVGRGEAVDPPLGTVRAVDGQRLLPAAELAPSVTVAVAPALLVHRQPVQVVVVAVIVGVRPAEDFAVPHVGEHEAEAGEPGEDEALVAVQVDLGVLGESEEGDVGVDEQHRIAAGRPRAGDRPLVGPGGMATVGGALAAKGQRKVGCGGDRAPRDH